MSASRSAEPPWGSIAPGLRIGRESGRCQSGPPSTACSRRRCGNEFYKTGEPTDSKIKARTGPRPDRSEPGLPTRPGAWDKGVNKGVADGCSQLSLVPADGLLRRPALDAVFIHRSRCRGQRPVDRDEDTADRGASSKEFDSANSRWAADPSI